MKSEKAYKMRWNKHERNTFCCCSSIYEERIQSHEHLACKLFYFISKKNFPSLHWCGDRRRSFFLFVKTTLFTPLIFRLSSTLMSRECVFGPSPRVKTSLAFTLQARRRKSDFALKIKLLLCNGHIASTCLHIHSDDANLPALAFFYCAKTCNAYCKRGGERECNMKSR